MCPPSLRSKRQQRKTEERDFRFWPREELVPVPCSDSETKRKRQICKSLLFEGTGNVLKIQEMLHICSEHFEQKDEEEKEKDSKDKDKDKDKKAEKSDDGSHQGVAVLGIALMAMGEEIGAQMVLRTCNHLVCIQDKSPFKTFLSSYFECQQKNQQS